MSVIFFNNFDNSEIVPKSLKQFQKFQNIPDKFGILQTIEKNLRIFRFIGNNYGIDYGIYRDPKNLEYFLIVKK